MTGAIDAFPLSRPEPARDKGPLDDHFYDLVEADFREVDRGPSRRGHVRRHPHRGPPPAGRQPGRDRGAGPPGSPRSRSRSRRSIRPACRPKSTSSATSSCTTCGLELFDLEVQRLWERRSTAMDGVGDALFGALRTRLRAARRTARVDHRPARGGARSSSASIDPGRADRRFGCGRSSSSSPAATLPCALRRDRGRRRGRLRRAEPAPPGRGCRAGQGGRRRLRRLAARHPRNGRRRAGRSGRSCTTSWSGCAPSTASMRTRSSRSAGQQLAEHQSARAASPGRSTRTSTSRRSINRLKLDHPATFEEALDGYREVMLRARAVPDRPRHRDRARTTSGSRSSRPPTTCAT